MFTLSYRRTATIISTLNMYFSLFDMMISMIMITSQTNSISILVLDDKVKLCRSPGDQATRYYQLNEYLHCYRQNHSKSNIEKSKYIKNGIKIRINLCFKVTHMHQVIFKVEVLVYLSLCAKVTFFSITGTTES